MSVPHTVASRYPTPERPRAAEQVVVYRDPAIFAAWPFVHGLWAFPDGEVLVGFTRAACAYAAPHDVVHRVVDGPAAEYVLLRSPDGGRSWPGTDLHLLGTRGALERSLLGGLAAAPAEPLDLGAPDTCLTAGFAIPPQGARHVGYLQYSRDRGRTWEGPYPTPSFGFVWVQAKPDYLVRPDGVVLLFVTVARGPHDDGRPGSRFVAVYATTDGGRSWNYLSAIQASVPDAAFVNRYYASPVLLPDGRIVAALRCQIDGRNAWPEVWASDDGGRTWRFLARVGDWGGPTHLLRLRDGRLLASYGYRVVPYGIRARLSEDGGQTWGRELILRDDGGSYDLGYPRAVQRGDGRVLVAYYMNTAADPVQCQGGVRHIAATIFVP
jgi:hypothetical protein